LSYFLNSSNFVVSLLSPPILISFSVQNGETFSYLLHVNYLITLMYDTHASVVFFWKVLVAR